MRIRFLGAAGEVTGSCYLIETTQATVLVDCGMFQGARSDHERNRDLGIIRPEALDAVVVTHAHQDHTGRLPLLRGLRASVHATPATVELSRIMLEDSARIQESEADRENRWREREGKPQVEPLYRREDVDAISARWSGLQLGQTREIATGVQLRFQEAGHILGSASVILDVTEQGALPKRIVFSGDIGQHGMPFIRDPDLCASDADLVVCESTYGDRDHRASAETFEELAEILRQAAWARHKVLVPAFAVGRAQLMIHAVMELAREGRSPQVPVYLDSPLAVKATKLYTSFCELLDDELQNACRVGALARDLAIAKPVLSGAESRELNELWEPMVVIAGSGMCNGGRIVHHLRHNLWRHGVQVVLPGFMAQGTLGRALVEASQGRRTHVRIMGQEVLVRAKIHTIGGLSAHAGKSGLLNWIAGGYQGRTKPKLALTHGEAEPRHALAIAAKARVGVDVLEPMHGDTIEL
ncbi:MAG: MBL fold metallo-hydrolase [Phycisphaerales bacterium]|nr:MBL fold metallo-hydrolase [Phycisphaerales bacterium]